MNFVKKGFTLIELLVVISIIGILIGLSVFGLQGARQSSRDAKRKTDLELIRSGLEIYKSDCDTYPTSLGLPGTSLIGTGAEGTPCSSSNTYISQIPADPSSGAYAYTPISTDEGLTYTKYYLCASLEQTPSPTPDPDILGNCGSCGSTSTCNYVVTNP
ncbi:MAG: prepilin-type N-terminal cleavage/methylation domain-containing protein [Candidatus Microgenomates bacterium]|jgi:type II secretion system protein G